MHLALSHVINPVKKGPNSDLFFAQPITFESLRIAQVFAKEKVNVNLVTVQYPEDRDIIPESFNKTSDIEKSVLDYREFKAKRKLPLIKDILDKGYEHSEESDFIVYSNVDIAVMPYFYLFIKNQIEKGLDAFVINRRTIAGKFNELNDLPLMYSEIGSIHPGFDCFVFKRNLYPHFSMGNACLGANWIGRVLLVNTKTFSINHKIFTDEHLTFHIGDDRNWSNKDFRDYDEFNKSILIDICLDFMKKYPDLSNFYKSILNDVGYKMVENNKPDSNVNALKFERTIVGVLKKMKNFISH